MNSSRRAAALAAVCGLAGGCAILDGLTSDDKFSTPTQLSPCNNDGSDVKYVGFQGLGLPPVDVVGIGDFDGDSIPDVILGGSGLLVIYGGTGPGGLESGPSEIGSMVSVGGGMIRHIVVADLDGDGLDDAAALMSGTARLQIVFGQAGRTLSTPIEWSELAPAAVGTLVDNGVPALVVAGGSTQDNMRMLTWNDGAGMFATTTTSAYGEPSSLSVGDVDGDGLDDVAFVHTDGIDVQFQGAGGVFTVMNGAAIDKGNLPFEQVVLAALDQNGSDDVYAIRQQPSGGNREVEVYRSNPEGDGPQHLMTVRLNYDVRGLAQVGDWDGNGSADLIIPGLGQMGSNLILLMAFNDGFECQRTMTAFTTGGAVETRSVAVGDINEDGLIDLAVTTMSGELVLALRQ